MAAVDINVADARDIFKNILKDAGFDNDQINQLLPQVTKWHSLYTNEEVMNNLLPTTDVYKQRFAGNQDRIKAGLPPLSMNQYIANETGYRAALRAAGLPTGFKDSKADFASFIANDVSVTEFNDRLTTAKKAIQDTDPYYTQALQSMYGLDAGHMVAHLLDPTAAQPLIEKQAKAAEYGAAAMRQGLATAPTSQYEAYASGVGTGVGAEQGMAQIASMAPGLETLAQISGDQYNQKTAEEEVFGGLASAQRKRQQLSQQEVDRFTGRSNVVSGSLNADNVGQF
jgi:hypothetical protein